MKKSELEIGLRYVNRERDNEIMTLRAALEGLASILDFHPTDPQGPACGCDFCQALERARAALAKAKGES